MQAAAVVVAWQWTVPGTRCDGSGLRRAGMLCLLVSCMQVSRLMGMGAEENVADQIAGKLEDMLTVVRKVRTGLALPTASATLQLAAGWLRHRIPPCMRSAARRCFGCLPPEPVWRVSMPAVRLFAAVAHRSMSSSRTLTRQPLWVCASQSSCRCMKQSAWCR